MSRRDISKEDEHAALEAYRTAACAEADAHFDERALEAQRHKILAKLAHLGHPARVIRFPKAAGADRPSNALNRRWVSVAAAAGLIIGLVGGQIVHLLPQPATRHALAPAAIMSAPAKIEGPTFVTASAPADDGLLGEIDLVMQVRAANELRALDEFTPFAEGK
jgi:hypothetical protein